MKILVVYQYYQGRDAAGHSLIFELTQYLADHGHDVTVISGETGYMNPSLPGVRWYRRLFRVEKLGNVRVIRTFSYADLHHSYLRRLLAFLSFTLSAPIGVLAAGRCDVMLASSPPIFPVFTSWLVSRVYRQRFVLEVRDLWPASAVQMGILRSRPLIAMMSWMEHLLYRHADRIIALTEGIRDDIDDRGLAEGKVDLVTCGVDVDRLYPDEIAGRNTRARFGWGDRFVVLYFGAIGEANNIPVILRAAERLREHDNITFVIVGNGLKRKSTEAWIEANNPGNITLLPPVPKSLARDYICAADACLATLLDIPLFDGAIPTKLIDYMACARPVLCGIRGEAGNIVTTSGAGLVFAPDDDSALASAVLEMAANPAMRSGMGQNGLRYVRDRFSAEEMRAETEAILMRAVSGRITPPGVAARREASGSGIPAGRRHRRIDQPDR